VGKFIVKINFLKNISLILKKKTFEKNKIKILGIELNS